MSKHLSLWVKPEISHLTGISNWRGRQQKPREEFCQDEDCLLWLPFFTHQVKVFHLNITCAIATAVADDGFVAAPWFSVPCSAAEDKGIHSRQLGHTSVCPEDLHSDSHEMCPIATITSTTTLEKCICLTAQNNHSPGCYGGLARLQQPHFSVLFFTTESDPAGLSWHLFIPGVPFWEMVTSLSPPPCKDILGCVSSPCFTHWL